MSRLLSPALCAVRLAVQAVFCPVECGQRRHGLCPGTVMKLHKESLEPSFLLFDSIGGHMTKMAVTKVEGAGLSGPESHHLHRALMDNHRSLLH